MPRVAIALAAQPCAAVVVRGAQRGLAIIVTSQPRAAISPLGRSARPRRRCSCSTPCRRRPSRPAPCRRCRLICPSPLLACRRLCRPILALSHASSSPPSTAVPPSSPSPLRLALRSTMAPIPLPPPSPKPPSPSPHIPTPAWPLPLRQPRPGVGLIAQPHAAVVSAAHGLAVAVTAPPCRRRLK